MPPTHTTGPMIDETARIPAPAPASKPAHDPHQDPHLPASAKAILEKLEGHSPMTGKQIREATGLPRRTIYTALQRLRALGMLQERQSLRDTRQTYFWLGGNHHPH